MIGGNAGCHCSAARNQCWGAPPDQNGSAARSLRIRRSVQPTNVCTKWKCSLHHKAARSREAVLTYRNRDREESRVSSRGHSSYHGGNRCSSGEQPVLPSQGRGRKQARNNVFGSPSE